MRLELPKQINARLEVVKKACTQAAYDAGNCGEAARIGVGSAVTVAAARSAQGNAYFVRNPASLARPTSSCSCAARSRST